MNRISKWMVVVLVGAMLLAVNTGLVAAAGGPPDGRGVSQGSAVAGYALGDALSDAQKEALISFWLDEYHALRTYEAIMDDFGAVQPFASIARAEEMHIQSLERAFERYGVEIPVAPGSIDVDFADIQVACEAAAQAEIANAGLYGSMESQFTQSDLVRVFDQLSSASLNNHLPAFEACADGETVPLEAGVMNQRAGGRDDDMTVRGNASRGASQNQDTSVNRQAQVLDGDCTAALPSGRRGR